MKTNKAKDMLQRGMSGKKMKKEDMEDDDEKEDEYEMPRKEAISEHERLSKILRSGDRAAQIAEAINQEKELKKIKAGK